MIVVRIVGVLMTLLLATLGQLPVCLPFLGTVRLGLFNKLINPFSNPGSTEWFVAISRCTQLSRS